MKKIITAIAITSAFSACMSPGNKIAIDDRALKNMEVQRKFTEEIFNKHNLAMIDSLIAPDYVEHCAAGYPADRAGLKKSFEDFIKAFPDMHEQINFMMADSNTVTLQYTFTGTSSGMMGGAGKKVNIDGVDIIKYKDGKAIGHWGYNDEVKMMTQMGMMPGMGGDSTKPKASDDDSKKM
jgi:predicted ester cyclase